jgi:hypothetical protein
MNEELKIIIGADVANFNGGVINVIKTIGELESELKQFQKEIKTLTGDEFLKMSDKIATAKANIAALKSVGSSNLPKLGEDAKKAAEGFDKLANPAGNAGNTLTNLSGVVRDLPFGFIAIQNNLPLVVDSFSSLAKQSGGVGGALKGLGSALIGPAGIGFAFGAVTSIVTSLIQNYGSLGNAIDVIFAKNKQAAEATATYNKELEKGQGTIGAEIATIDILTKRLTNLQAPYKSRQDAYNELKKVQPDILRGMSEENALSASSVGAILANANARKQLLLIKIQENAINKVLDENAGKILKLENERNKAINEEAAQREKLNALKKTAPEGSDKVRREEIALSFLAQTTAKAREEVDKLQKVQDSYISKLDPLVGKIAEINNQTQKGIDKSKAEADAKKTQTKANDDLAASINKVTKAEAEKQAKQSAERTQQALIPNFGIEQAKPINPLATAGAVNPFVGSPIKESLLQEASAAAAARTEYEKYAASVSTLVAPAIDNLFSALQNGTNVFEAIGQSVKALVVDIIKAIAKAAILKAITTAVSAGSGAGFFGGLFSALSGSIGGVAAPTFGGGAGLGGGLALNGEVIFVQRGTDLVGVLNRGNSQINRVG